MEVAKINLSGPDVKQHLVDFLFKKYSKGQIYDLPDTYIFMYEQWGEFKEESFQMSFVVEKQKENNSVLFHMVGAGYREINALDLITSMFGEGTITQQIKIIHKELINYMSYRNIAVGELDLTTKKFMD